MVKALCLIQSIFSLGTLENSKMKQIFILRDKAVVEYAREYLSGLHLDALRPLKVVIDTLTRTGEQNAKFHAMLSNVAKQKKWMNRELTPIQWKTLFISAHATATNQGADIVAGLENEYVNIRESSAQMSVARMNSLIEYVNAWCVMNDIKMSEI